MKRLLLVLAFTASLFASAQTYGPIDGVTFVVSNGDTELAISGTTTVTGDFIVVDSAFLDILRSDGSLYGTIPSDITFPSDGAIDASDLGISYSILPTLLNHDATISFYRNGMLIDGAGGEILDIESNTISFSEGYSAQAGDVWVIIGDFREGSGPRTGAITQAPPVTQIVTDTLESYIDSHELIDGIPHQSHFETGTNVFTVTVRNNVFSGAGNEWEALLIEPAGRRIQVEIPGYGISLIGTFRSAINDNFDSISIDIPSSYTDNVAILTFLQRLEPARTTPVENPRVILTME